MTQNSFPTQQKGCLAALFHWRGAQPAAANAEVVSESQDEATAAIEPLPYRKRDDFLSPAEKNFYKVIKGMLGSHFVICPKVSLADLFFVARPHENQSATNRINRKHVDFVICEPLALTPLFAIELDDSSHERPDRIERDVFVDRVFAAANLPLLHIPLRRGYNPNELGVLFKQVIPPEYLPNHTTQQEAGGDGANSSTSSAEAAPEKTGESSPSCPKCGIPMLLRIAKTGTQAGRKFYGCANYPKCREVLPVPPAA